MKGFGILLALASAAVLLICGPPALFSGDAQNQIELQCSIADAGPLVSVETPGVSPAVAQVVHDPGSCSGQLEAVVVTSESKTTCRPVRRLGSGVKRLLNFLPFC